MASKSGQQEPEKAEVIEELLDALDTALDRVKVLYEQYFLGIQKQPPAYLHTDVERKLRDLAQIQIRNTALRYRFATLQQKYGSYNTYWRRTLRQIENGTYTRNLYKFGRQAAKTGAAVPEEILAAMPKRMREQVIRDREAALAVARLRERQVQDDELLTLADGEVDIDVADLDAAFIHESSDVRRSALSAGGAHRVDESDADFDLEGFFASVAQDDAPARDTLSRSAAAEPPGDAAERGPRSSRPSSHPPAVARTATGHPRPASASGSPVAAAPPGGAAARSRRPSTKRPPTDEGPLSFAEAAGATRRTTGSMRAVRPPSSPGVEPPRSPTGRMQAVRPPSSDPEPRLSVPPIGAASPGAATRKITGPMRAVRPPSSDDPEPAGSPPIDLASAAPPRATGRAATSRPAPGEAEPRLSIPPIRAATPAAATRRITPPSRAAVGPPSDLDPEPSGTASPGRATGESRAVAEPSGAGPGSDSGLVIRITGQSRAGAAPPSAEAGSASSRAASGMAGQSRAGAAPPSGEAGPASGPPVRDAGAFADESTQRSRPAGIPVISPVVPAGGARLPGSSGPQAVSPPPVERLDPAPARTAPSQATTPLRVAPGSAAAHPDAPVETLAGPFPRSPGPLPSLPPTQRAAAPPEPPPIPAPPQRRSASAPAPVEAPAPASSPASAPPASRDGAVPASDAPRPAPASPLAARRTPPPMRAVSPPAPPVRADAPRSAAAERPPPELRQGPPPGMTHAEVNALYAKYVKAKQILGEEAEPGTYGKLLRTIHNQAPKIMQQYKAKGVDFSVVVKDNQVIIRAKPKP